MSKTKLRCNTCGKWFQSANAKDVTCPDCTQKARKAKLAQKNTPPATNTPPAGNKPAAIARPAPPPKTKSASGTNQWLDNLVDVKISEPEPPPQRPKIPSPPVHRESTQGGGYHGATENRGSQHTPSTPSGTGYQRNTPFNRSGAPDRTERPEGNRYQGNSGPRPARPAYRDGSGHGPQAPGKPWQKQGPGANAKGPARGKPKSARPAPPPKPKKEKIPPPEPFTPTEEQIKQVEERYLALCQPAEFDGIRTQISKEFSIPKRAIKKIIKDLRDRQHIPSWWELQTYKGSKEELERIKTAYEPYLPVPPVGIHKQIATNLDLKPGVIYQAIKSIRQELNLPQYNDPSTHKDSAGEKVAAGVSTGSSQPAAEGDSDTNNEQNASSSTKE